jgi:hypothetical protein
MPLLSTTIFVSYAREDSELALKLCGDLKIAGVNVWLDQLDIPPGKHWDRAVEEALERSKYLIVILSPSSVASDNVMDEVSYAIDEKKHIVPVIIGSCRLPLRLRRFEFIDFTGDYGSSLNKLLSVLRDTAYPNEQSTDEKTALGNQDTSRERIMEPANAPLQDKAMLDKPSTLISLAKQIDEAMSKIPGLRQDKKVVTYKSHKIEVLISTLQTAVRYDGKEVSNRVKLSTKFSIKHVFQVVEDGRQVLYEVKIRTRWGPGLWLEVQRDREVIFNDR